MQYEKLGAPTWCIADEVCLDDIGMMPSVLQCILQTCLAKLSLLYNPHFSMHVLRCTWEQYVCCMLELNARHAIPMPLQELATDISK